MTLRPGTTREDLEDLLEETPPTGSPPSASESGTHPAANADEVADLHADADPNGDEKATHG